MELRHLITFERIVHFKSYSKAAEALFVSQPAISAHISELERDLGIKLFYRHKSPIQLTAGGMILFEYSKQILELVKQATDAIDGFTKGITGPLKMSVSESVFEWFPPYLNKFKSLYPQIDIELGVNLSPITIEKVISKEINLGVIRPSIPNWSNALLNCINIGEDEIIMVCSPSNPIFKCKTITKEHIKMSSIIAFGKDTDYGKLVTNIIEECGISPNTNIWISNLQATMRFLEKSNNVAFIPKRVVKMALDEGRLITRSIEGL